VGGLLDPINLASNFIPVGRIVGLAGKAGTTVLTRTASRAALGAVEGAGGAAITEAAINYPLAQKISDDYTIENSLQNMVYGGLFGAGLHAGAGLLKEGQAKFFKKGETPTPEVVSTPKTETVSPSSVAPEDLPAAVDTTSVIADRPPEPGVPTQLEKLGTETKKASFNAAFSQALDGKRIDVQPVIDAENAKLLSELEKTRAFIKNEIANPTKTPAEIREAVLRRREIEEKLGTAEPKEGYVASEFEPAKFTDKVEAATAVKNELDLRTADPDMKVKVTYEGVPYNVERGNLSSSTVGLYDDAGNILAKSYEDLIKDPGLKIEYGKTEIEGGPATKQFVEEYRAHRADPITNPDPVAKIKDRMEAKAVEPLDSTDIDLKLEESTTSLKQELDETVNVEDLAGVNEQIQMHTSDLEDMRARRAAKDGVEPTEVKTIQEVKLADEALKKAREDASILQKLSKCVMAKRGGG
jgi:hypothetical protein